MIVVDDYTHITSNTGKLFERWRNYVRIADLQDNQLVCVSRPDMYITENIRENPLNEKLMMSFDTTRSFAHDMFFICRYDILRQIVDQYDDFERKYEYRPDGSLLKLHDYMYICAQKFNAQNITMPGYILRPGFPDVPRTTKLLNIYSETWHKTKFIKK